MRDPYKVLGVDRNATEEQIKNAYRELARKYHPDNFSGKPLLDVAEEKMQEINSAYDAVMEERRTQGQARSDYQGSSEQFSEVRRLLDSGDVQGADAALENMPASMRGHEWNFLKGQVFYKRGWMEQAENYFEKASRAQPDNPEYSGALNQLKWQRGGNYGSPGSYGGPYRNTGMGGCSACDLCSGLCCADTCCECAGGDLCTCC